MQTNPKPPFVRALHLHIYYPLLRVTCEYIQCTHLVCHVPDIYEDEVDDGDYFHDEDED